MTGQTISHYRVLEKLGEGGMGVVYKGEDLKLRRLVALKFLRSDAVESEERKARFLREAEAAAALHHPNICTVYEIDEVDGQTFIAMANIEGRSLDKAIDTAPLEVRAALDIAGQIAQGLRAAHTKGIVHRDIKPANLMLTEVSPSQRHVTIMDFGLAHLLGRSKLTEKNATLGTVAYMSPEQAGGTGLDQRSDIWTLGVVLYEMVTGQLPFEGLYNDAVMYSILNEEHEPITARRAGVPMELEWIVGKALSKDPDDRYQQIEEMAVDLRLLQKKLEAARSSIQRSHITGVRGTAEISAAAAGWDTQLGAASKSALRSHHGMVAASLAAEKNIFGRAFQQIWQANVEIIQQRPHSTLKLIQVMRFMILASLAVIVAIWLNWPEMPEAPLRKSAFAVEGVSPWLVRAAISPDGKHIAFRTADAVGGTKLWIRDFSRDEPREINGSEGAGSLFWSPDSQFIGFDANGELKKVSVLGGAPTVLCSVPGRSVFGGSWSPSGDDIAFSSRALEYRIYRVPAQGGTPQALFEPVASEEGPANVFPSYLPQGAGARSILFAAGSQTGQEIMVRNLETGETRVLADGNHPVYSPSGHIVFDTSGGVGLWALPFSLQTLTPTGDPFPIAPAGDRPSIAQDGTLVYSGVGAPGPQQLVWRERDGTKTGTIGQPQEAVRAPALSPDGLGVVVMGEENGNRDIWIHETARPVKTRFTFHEAVDISPTWSPSGDRIAFSSGRKGVRSVYVKSLDAGSELKELLSADDLRAYLTDWSSDERVLLYYQQSQESAEDLWYLRQTEGAEGFEPVQFMSTPFNERSPKLSPDGRFVAYAADESGRFEVYVQSFPRPGGRRQVSQNGGSQPRWSRDGKELFYVEADALVAAPVATSPDFSFGAAKVLFRSASLKLAFDNVMSYDVTADSKRFVLWEPLEESSPETIRVVQNWHQEFRDHEQD